MPIRFVECDTITDKIAETAELQRQHWEEVAKNKEVMVLSADTAQYAALEQQGRIFGVLAYDGDQIVGYSVNFLLINLHYSALLISQNDLLFVAKSHRAGRTGVRLMQETERIAARRGARMVIFHAKEDTPFNQILPRLGYGVQDVLHSKQLPASNYRSYGSFDVQPALLELNDRPWLWDEFTARQNAPGSNHKDTRAIILRGPDCEIEDLNQDVAQGMIECRDWPTAAQLPAMRDLCAAACARLRVKDLGRVMLAELRAGGHILRHADQGAYAEHYQRFHLPLTSDWGNEFDNDGERLHMQPGELWKFNHRAEHEVFNKSTTPRIHLIIDTTTE